MTREELFIKRINEKQRGAFRELFREYYHSLVIFAMRYIKEQSTAEDVVQDLFIAVWEKKDQFVSYNGFRVFLYRSVRNACLDLLKHRKVEEKYTAYNRLHTELSEAEELEIMEEEVYRKLFALIDELPPRCREVFLLHLDGKKNEEIAAELHITLLTVKTQKKRATRYLREHMGDLFFFLLGMNLV